MHPVRYKRLQIEAARWILRLPKATADERTKFFEWLKTSKHHVRELLLAYHIDRALADLRKVRRRTVMDDSETL